MYLILMMIMMMTITFDDSLIMMNLVNDQWCLIDCDLLMIISVDLWVLIDEVHDDDHLKWLSCSNGWLITTAMSVTI